jgi:hypothetical protein
LFLLQGIGHVLDAAADIHPNPNTLQFREHFPLGGGYAVCSNLQLKANNPAAAAEHQNVWHTPLHARGVQTAGGTLVELAPASRKCGVDRLLRQECPVQKFGDGRVELALPGIMREVERLGLAQRRATLTGPERPPGLGVRCPLELRPRFEARFQSPGKPPSVHGIRFTGPLRPGGLSCRAIPYILMRRPRRPVPCR